MVSLISTASFSTLPPELIYKIFVYLDAQTIVRKIRCISKRFYRIVNNYDEFNFNFTSILKCDFLLLCNYIQHDKIISLTLSDNDQTPGQIQLFLSLFRLNQFTRLRSLSLLEIDDCYLNIVLKDMKKLELNSLIIHTERDYSEDNTNRDDLLSVMSLPTLQKLVFKMPNFLMSSIIWPIESKIQHLEMTCQQLNDYYNIVRHFPNLRTLILEGLHQQIHDGIIPKPDDLEPFHQLESLTIKSCHTDMIIIELILSLTPTIEYLQLMRCVPLDVFTTHLSEWEKFVQLKLPLLNKFEFFLLDQSYNYLNNSVDVESIVNPFRKSFWIETKKWFVECIHLISPRAIILHTLSLFDQQFLFIYQSKQTSSPTVVLNTLNNQIKKISLDLEVAMPSVTSAQGGLPKKIIYPNVEQLTLNIGYQWPLSSLRFLSSLIDLSNLRKLSLQLDNSFYCYPQLMNNINQLFKLTINIHSLEVIISTGFANNINDENIKIINLINKNIKHLTITISTVGQMQMIVRQLKHLSTITFLYRNNYYDYSDMHLLFLKRETGYYSYRLNNSSMSLWFDNQIQ